MLLGGDGAPADELVYTCCFLEGHHEPYVAPSRPLGLSEGFGDGTHVA